MSGDLFLQLTLVELAFLAFAFGPRVWRRLGPRRATTVATLLLVLAELAIVVVKGGVTEDAQVLAFLAAVVFFGRTFADEEMREAAFGRRFARRLSRR